MQTKSEIVLLPAYSRDVRFFCETHPLAYNEFADYTYHIEEQVQRYEVMTPNSTGSHHTWKNFEHYKCINDPPGNCGLGFDLYQDQWWYASSGHLAHSTVYDPLLGYYQYGSDNWIIAPFGEMGRPVTGLPTFYLVREDGGFVPPPADLDNLIVRALQASLPIIKSELSILNSIYELKDFKRPCESALSLLGSQSFRALIQRMKASIGKLTVGRVVQMAAGGYLQASFNILPLISDIRAVIRVLSRTSGRINDLITRSGRTQNKHWMFKWDEYIYQNEVSGSGAWLISNSPTQLCNAIRRVYSEPTVFHVQIQYNYNYTEYQVVHAQLLAMLDALGIQLNPAIIWNAIPWSFVIDWVAGVSRYLSTLKVENMRPKINICRCLWSVERKRTITIEKGISSCSVPRPFSRNLLPATYETAYRRQVFMPSSSSIELSGLSPTELSLGAALVVARRRRHNKRII